MVIQLFFSQYLTFVLRLYENDSSAWFGLGTEYMVSWEG